MLTTFERDPERLVTLGFVRRDEQTTELSRWVRFERALDQEASQLRLLIQIEFELTLTDEPVTPPDLTYSYAFNGVFLEVVNRKMTGQTMWGFDTDTEDPIIEGRYALAIASIGDVQHLIRLLCPAPAIGGGVP